MWGMPRDVLETIVIVGAGCLAIAAMCVFNLNARQLLFELFGRSLNDRSGPEPPRTPAEPHGPGRLTAK